VRIGQAQVHELGGRRQVAYQPLHSTLATGVALDAVGQLGQSQAPRRPQAVDVVARVESALDEGDATVGDVELDAQLALLQRDEPFFFPTDDLQFDRRVEGAPVQSQRAAQSCLAIGFVGLPIGDFSGVHTGLPDPVGRGVDVLVQFDGQRHGGESDWAGVQAARRPFTVPDGIECGKPRTVGTPRCSALRPPVRRAAPTVRPWRLGLSCDFVPRAS